MRSIDHMEEIQENTNIDEPQRRSPTDTRKRTSCMMVSDDESSTDKSNKITRTRSAYAKPPPSQTYWEKRGVATSLSTDRYEDDDEDPPKPAQSEPSVGNIQSDDDEYVDEASSHDYDLSQPDHHKSPNFDELPIRTAADQPIKSEKSMAESDYGFPTPNHHETARKTVLGSEKQIISNSRAPGMGGNQNPWKAECDHGAAFLKISDLNGDCSSEKQHAQPLIRAAWLGSFTINSDWGKISETFDGLQGYVSSKACPMVRLVAGKLPEAIRWEKLPKWRVWPKGFQRQGGPTDDDIAVFFFPSLEKDESEYERFVFELIRGDFALRATVMGSELLVFTSVDLPPLFTRFQGNLYLWGVFRGNPHRLI